MDLNKVLGSFKFLDASVSLFVWVLEGGPRLWGVYEDEYRRLDRWSMVSGVWRVRATLHPLLSFINNNTQE